VLIVSETAVRSLLFKETVHDEASTTASANVGVVPAPVHVQVVASFQLPVALLVQVAAKPSMGTVDNKRRRKTGHARIPERG
jgi:MFS-type transporter involved in bile tolerance (Atg22 family)